MLQVKAKKKFNSIKDTREYPIKATTGYDIDFFLIIIGLLQILPSTNTYRTQGLFDELYSEKQLVRVERLMTHDTLSQRCLVVAIQGCQRP